MSLGIRTGSALCRSYVKGSTSLATATWVRANCGNYFPKYILEVSGLYRQRHDVYSLLGKAKSEGKDLG
jgi:hypothetical protein